MAAVKPPRADRWAPEEIRVPSDRLLKLKEPTVMELMESISAIGLQTPIDVYLERSETEGDLAILIAGRHRAEACKRLGIPLVDVRIFENQEHAARWEADENLARVHLTPAEQKRMRDAMVRREEKRAISPHLAAKLKSPSNPKGAGRPKGAVARAAEKLGVSKDTVRRAVKAVEQPTEGHTVIFAAPGDPKTPRTSAPPPPTEQEVAARGLRELRVWVQRYRDCAPLASVVAAINDAWPDLAHAA